MDLGLAGARAFVGGGSAGIGFATAALLIEEGASVVICARDGERLERARAELIRQKPGAEVHAIRADLGGVEATTAVEQAVRTLGGLDVLVANSGGPATGNFAALDDLAWQSACEQTLLSTVRMVRAASPALRASAHARALGRVIVISSTSVKQPIEHLVLSNSIRLAVVGLCKSLANELGADGVTVNVVCPGMTDTGRLRELDQAVAAKSARPVDEITRERARSIPLGRLGRPEEIAATVVFLASRRASYLTGTTLAVDGGLVRFPL